VAFSEIGYFRQIWLTSSQKELLNYLVPQFGLLTWKRWQEI
jgi:hypothetical protein